MTAALKDVTSSVCTETKQCSHELFVRNEEEKELSGAEQ